MNWNPLTWFGTDSEDSEDEGRIIVSENPEETEDGFVN